VISTDAFNIGASAVPDPLTDGAYPWLFWKVHAFHFGGVDPENAAEIASVRHSFDIRSMRKVKGNETLAFIFQYADSNGAPAMTLFAAQTRVLFGH